jgi:hypothetical protein
MSGCGTNLLTEHDFAVVGKRVRSSDVGHCLTDWQRNGAVKNILRIVVSLGAKDGT